MDYAMDPGDPGPLSQTDINLAVDAVRRASQPGEAGERGRATIQQILAAGSTQMNGLIAGIVSNPQEYGIEAEPPPELRNIVESATGTPALAEPAEEESTAFRRYRSLIRNLYSSTLSPDPQVRLEGQEYIAAIRQLPALKAQLDSDSPQVRQAAAAEFEALNSKFGTTFQSIPTGAAETIADAIDHPEKYSLRAVTPRRQRGRPAAAAKPAGRAPTPIEEGFLRAARVYKTSNPQAYTDFIEAYKLAYTNPASTEGLRRAIGFALVQLGESVPSLEVPPAAEVPPEKRVRGPSAKGMTPAAVETPPPAEQPAPPPQAMPAVSTFAVQQLGNPVIERNILLHYEEYLALHPDEPGVSPQAGVDYWSQIMKDLTARRFALPPIDTMYVFHQACALGNRLACVHYRRAVDTWIGDAMAAPAEGETPEMQRDFARTIIGYLEILNEGIPSGLREAAERPVDTG